MISVAEKQLNLLKLASEYIKKISSKNVDVAMSSFCYMNAQEITPGYLKLKNLQLNNKLNLRYIYVVLKHLFSVSTLHNFQIFNESALKNLKENNYDTLVISWASKKNFNEDGSFSDPKFRINSKNKKNILWFLIYLDEELPKKNDNNLIIFYKNKKKIK